jgi:hypothetical protein
MTRKYSLLIETARGDDLTKQLAAGHGEHFHRFRRGAIGRLQVC